MNPRWALAATAALLLLAPAIWAADGDDYTGSTYRGPARRILLCDSKTTTGACNAGVGIVPPNGYETGPVNFEIAKDTGCASCTVEIRVGSGTDEKHLVHTLTCGSSTSHTLQTGISIAGLIYPNVTAASTCTDLDIVGHFGGIR